MALTPLDLSSAQGAGPFDPDDAYSSLVESVESSGITLYPAQDEAIIELASRSNVILATPTGSGKSMVAIAAHFFALRQGIRSFYTAPIKALVSEKFFALCQIFGSENVGMMTGDAAVNAGAPIICATAEIVANIALREGASADIGQVVMDEFHYYSEPDRGWAWQVPIIELPQAQFLLMSATLGDTTFFEKDLTRRTGRQTVLVSGSQRPVPLHYSYEVRPTAELLELLVKDGQAPVYVVHFTQAAAIEQAQALMSLNITSKEEKQRIKDAVAQFRFTAGFGKTLARLISAGIGVHHAGMLPKYRRLVERLAQEGALKIICGTDTLGVGINVPIRTVLLTGLTKFDGSQTRHLKAREFHQIAGRAGRAGYDTYGNVIVQAPEHEIENAKAIAKAGNDPKKLKKLQRKKPPEGFVSWSRGTFDRLVHAEPEPLVSRFTVTTSMLLNVIAREGNCFVNMRHLLEDNHESRAQQRRHIVRAIELYRGLLASGIVTKRENPDHTGRWVELTGELQREFALNQPLSPLALAAFDILDPSDPDYALNVVSVIEATLDDPRQVLLAQQNMARGEAVAALKAEGVEYDERMAIIEDISWPTPLRDELDYAYDVFAQTQPWIKTYSLSPKSVLRDMVTRVMGFGEFVAFYKLSRSEGSVLRYLTDVYRALRHTVPDDVKTDELDEIIEWLGELIRHTDSSLLDEWEQLSNPESIIDAPELGSEIRGITANLTAFRKMVRNSMFRLVLLAERENWDAMNAIDDSIDWEDELWDYYEEYDELRTDSVARGNAYFVINDLGNVWEVRQILADPNDDRGWAITAQVDLEASDSVGEPVFRNFAVSR